MSDRDLTLMRDQVGAFAPLFDKVRPFVPGLPPGREFIAEVLSHYGSLDIEVKSRHWHARKRHVDFLNVRNARQLLGIAARPAPGGNPCVYGARSRGHLFLCIAGRISCIQEALLLTAPGTAAGGAAAAR
jgi:hypothetical protein